jgi:transposase
MAKSPQRRTFNHEFKVEAVRAIADGKKTARQVARELGVRADLILRWRRELEGRPGPGASNGSAVMSQDEEIRQLRQELARVTEERDILKKATAFFAKESR